MISVHKTNLSGAFLDGAFLFIFGAALIKTCRKNTQDNKQEKNNIKHYILPPFWVTQVSLDYSNYGFAARNYTLIERNTWYCEGQWPRDASVRCYVTGSLRARGVNQQRHVSKGASPAHSSEVALKRSNLQNNAAPVFTSRHEPSRFHVARSWMQHNLNYARGHKK